MSFTVTQNAPPFQSMCKKWERNIWTWRSNLISNLCSYLRERGVRGDPGAVLPLSALTFHLLCVTLSYQLKQQNPHTPHDTAC